MAIDFFYLPSHKFMRVLLCRGAFSASLRDLAPATYLWNRAAICSSPLPRIDIVAGNSLSGCQSTIKKMSPLSQSQAILTMIGCSILVTNQKVLELEWLF
jgi:hypothetical protein